MCKGKCTLPQQFKRDAEVIPKVEVFLHVNDVVSIIFVFLQQSIKDLHFYQSLAVKSEILNDMGMVTSTQATICISANATKSTSLL